MQIGRGAICLCMLVAALVCQAQGKKWSDVHKKWIIVTTINYTTEPIRILANMTDWKVSRLVTQCSLAMSRLMSLLATGSIPYRE